MKTKFLLVGMKARVARHFLAGSRSSRDLGIIFTLAIIVFAISANFDLFNKVISWVYRHDTWQLDELFTVAVCLVFAIAFYAWRRHRELVVQIRGRQQAEAARARLIPELETALADASQLRKLLPICSSCKRVRDAKGYWSHVEDYLEVNLQARLDGGLCPDCAREFYADGHGSPRQPNRIQRRAR
jgi:hypothetical protein